MPSYTLELEIFGVYTTDIPQFEIWAEGALDSTHNALSSGSTISVTINYGGSLPASLEFRFNDGFLEGGRTIEVRSVKINDKYVNTGNYLSIDSLTNGGAAGVVDVADSDFIFAPTVDMTQFAGATSLTAGNDFYYNHLNTNLIIDGLGGNDSIIVSQGNDNINGGAGDDYITTGVGTDYIFGDTGNDTIWAGDDNDTVFAGDDNDRVYGGNGDDELHGGNGDDRLSGQAGDDEITGGAGADRITGGSGTNHLYGDGGDDIIMGGSGIDTIDGGADNDRLFGGGNNDIIDGGDGDDNLYGGNGDDTLNGNDGDDGVFGGAGNDTLYGSAGADNIHGEDGTDTLDGGIGNDTLVGGSGADTLTGGDGNDILHGHGLDANEIRTVLRANPNVEYNGQTNSFYQYVAGPTTWTAAQTAANASLINGIGGHLVNITSAVENAVIYQFGVDNGASSATGGAGNRIWLGGSDVVTDQTWVWENGVESGVQFSSAGTAFNGLYENWGSGQPNNSGGAQVYATMWFNGGGDDDTWDDRNATDGHNYVIEWDAGLMLDDNAVDTIDGGDGNDHIYGYGGDDILNGNADNDLMIGGAGDDTITGGTGADTLVGGEDADTIDAGSGNDSILLANGDFAAGESIDGGADTDDLGLTNATTVDFTTGTLSNLETLTGSGGNDDVTYTIQQALDFTTIDMGAGTDNSRVQISGTVDVTALGTPTVNNAENGFLTGSTGNDDLTITGAQLDALVFGSGIVNFDTGTDVINLTSTSADLNSLGATDASVLGLEQINASTAAGAVTIDLNGQTEDFTVTASANGDTITTGSGADTINGGAGADVITTGAGIDTVTVSGGNDTVNLANGDFGVGESIDGGADTDELILTNATTVDFTTGTLSNLETFTGSTGNDDVTMSLTVVDQFTTLDLGGGTDNMRLSFSGTIDMTAITAPTISNTENGYMIGSTGNDRLLIDGSVDFTDYVYGSGTLDFGGGTGNRIDVLGTPTSFNTLALDDSKIVNLRSIYYDPAFDSVVDLSAQSEDFFFRGYAGGNDTAIGGSGDDSFYNEGGVDTLVGNSGDDLFTIEDSTFTAGTSIDGGADSDILVIRGDNDISTGTITDVETFRGDNNDQNVSMTVQQALSFSTIDMRSGTTDIVNSLITGTVNVTSLGTPTITVSTEIGNLVGSTGNEDLTISGAQLNALIYGTGTVDFDTGTDVLRLTSTSANLNTLGTTDASISGLEEIDFSTAAAAVTLDMSGQTEDLIVTGSASADTLTTGSGNDTINLANSDFGAGESIDGGGGTDELIFTNATTVDFTTGTLSNLETLTGSSSNDDVTYTIQQALDFTTIDLGAGTDTTNINISGTVDVTALGTPTVSNAEIGNLTGSAGADDLTITGAQLNALVFGTGIIDFDGGFDVMNLTSTSTNLNTLGATDASIVSLEYIDASSAAAAVTIDLSGQTEGFSGIVGSSNNDTLIGGSGSDVLSGGDGDDILTGNAGSDVADYLAAAAGVTVDLNITVAQNTVGAGNDTITGIESLEGSTFNDTLTGNNSANSAISGNAGDDIIDGGDGDNFLDGGADTDTVSYASATAGVTVDLSNGAAQNTVGAGIDTLSNFENITGSNFNDTLTGDSGNNTIDAGTGDDRIYGGTGTNTIDGGVGTDWIDYSSVAGVTVDLSTNSGRGGLDTLNNIENVDGGTTADNITGDGNANEINGNNGSDILNGGGGNDTINGGSGNDTIDGGTGDDTLDGGSGSSDLLTYATAGSAVTVDLSVAAAQNTVGAGTDTISNFENLTGSDFNDTLNGNGSSNTINGGDGDDNITVYGAVAATDVINVDFGTGTDGFVYADDIFDNSNQPAYASGVRITTDGNTANGALEVTLGGIDGADLGPISGAWQETMNFANDMANVTVSFAYRALNSGGAPFETGEDLFLYATFDDMFLSNTANDYFDNQADPNNNYDSGWQTITVTIGAVSAGNHTLSLGGAITLKTEAGEEIDIRYDDVVVSGEVVGNSGVSNTVNGGDGNDTIDGGLGDDTIDGGANDDIISSFSGADDIDGGSGDDTINSGSGADTVEGGTGNDTLIGGDGADDLYGVDAADHAVATAAGDSGVTNLYSANFDASAEGWVYQDGYFGGAANNGYASGVRITTDGDAGNGALEISVGGIDNSDRGPMSGAWEEVIDLGGAQTDVVLSFSYRVLDAVPDGDPWDAGEDLQLFVDVDGTQYGTNGNNYFFELLAADSDASYDSGWLRASVNIGSLTAGNHTWRVGGSLSFKTFASEEYDIRFDDISIDTVAMGTATGTTNIISGGDGLDTLYGSTETDIFTFDADAFNDIDVIEKFDFDEVDALDISDILTDFDGNITDYVQFTDSGGNTLVGVDANGTTGGTSFTTIAQINGLTGLDEEAFFLNGSIIV